MPLTYLLPGITFPLEKILYVAASIGIAGAFHEMGHALALTRSATPHRLLKL